MTQILTQLFRNVYFWRVKSIKLEIWKKFYTTPPSALSRCILVPFEHYWHPQKSIQKSSFNTFLSLFCYICPSPNALNIKYFWILSYNYGGGDFWVSLNCPILNFKKKVCLKNAWMQHCHLLDWYKKEKGSCII